MYDRFSLGRILRMAGFEDIQVVTPTLSGIVGWAVYELDCGPDGDPFKPDSLYVEGINP